MRVASVRFGPLSVDYLQHRGCRDLGNDGEGIAIVLRLHLYILYQSISLVDDAFWRRRRVETRAGYSLTEKQRPFLWEGHSHTPLQATIECPNLYLTGLKTTLLLGAAELYECKGMAVVALR
jgi:hypothetical protein